MALLSRFLAKQQCNVSENRTSRSTDTERTHAANRRCHATGNGTVLKPPRHLPRWAGSHSGLTKAIVSTTPVTSLTVSLVAAGSVSAEMTTRWPSTSMIQ